MKNSKLLFLLLSFVLLSCEKSTEESVLEATPTLSEKYIDAIEITSTEFDAPVNVTFAYDSNNRIINSTSYEDNTTSKAYLNYNADNTPKAAIFPDEVITISDAYKTPYNLFEVCDVMEYDAKGNPKLLRNIEEHSDYVYINNSYKMITTIDTVFATITYENTGIFMFYTLKASGVFEVLDQIELFPFATNQSVIKAKQLFPYNNIKYISVKNSKGALLSEVNYSYTYNSASYPTTIQQVATEYSEYGETYYSVQDFTIRYR